MAARALLRFAAGKARLAAAAAPGSRVAPFAPAVERRGPLAPALAGMHAEGAPEVAPLPSCLLAPFSAGGGGKGAALAIKGAAGGVSKARGEFITTCDSTGRVDESLAEILVNLSDFKKTLGEAAAALGSRIEPFAPAVVRCCTLGNAPAVPRSRPLAGAHVVRHPRLIAPFSSWGKGATFTVAEGSTEAVKIGGGTVDCAKPTFTVAEGSAEAVKIGGVAVDYAKRASSGLKDPAFTGVGVLAGITGGEASTKLGDMDRIGVNLGEINVYDTNPATTGPKKLTFTSGDATKETAGDVGVLYGHTAPLAHAAAAAVGTSSVGWETPSAAALGTGGEAGRSCCNINVDFAKPVGRRCVLAAAFFGPRASALVGPQAVRHLPLRLFATSTGVGGTKPGDNSGVADAAKPGDSSGGVGKTNPGDSSDGLGVIKPGDSSGEGGPVEDKAAELDKKGEEEGGGDATKGSDDQKKEENGCRFHLPEMFRLIESLIKKELLETISLLEDIIFLHINTNRYVQFLTSCSPVQSFYLFHLCNP